MKKLNEKEVALLLAKGARDMGVSFDEFIEGLELYVNDTFAIDRPPLLGWFNFGVYNPAHNIVMVDIAREKKS